MIPLLGEATPIRAPGKSPYLERNMRIVCLFGYGLSLVLSSANGAFEPRIGRSAPTVMSRALLGAFELNPDSPAEAVYSCDPTLPAGSARRNACGSSPRSSGSRGIASA